MNTRQRAYHGTMTGILWAYLSVPAALTFIPNMPLGFAILVCSILVVFSPFVAALIGPGAFLLSWIHALQMERWARLALTPRQIRTVGVILGVPLGIANLIWTVWLLSLLNSTPPEKLVLSRELAILMIPAVAGGAGLGWGVTSDWAAPRPRFHAKPLIRRDGPPFFDNRRRAA